MTPPINSFQDILDALQQDPALRDQLRTHILTEELIQLPAQFMLLRTDVDEIKARVDQLAAGQERLEGQVGNLQGQVGNLQGQVGNLQGQVGNLQGGRYEESAARRIVARAQGRLGLQNPRIAFSQTDPPHPDFNRAMSAATSTGLISQDQLDDLTEADLIIYGQGAAHAVCEISLRADQDDLDRARRRADILQEATGERVNAVVATPDPHPALFEAAGKLGVSVIDIPRRDS